MTTCLIISERSTCVARPDFTGIDIAGVMFVLGSNVSNERDILLHLQEANIDLGLLSYSACCVYPSDTFKFRFLSGRKTTIFSQKNGWLIFTTYCQSAGGTRYRSG
jgi:hypothetical protein